MVDWPRLLSQHGIEFRTSGAFEVQVKCPWCGAADPSQHLSISLRGRGWRCFRAPTQHVGKSNVRLLAALLRCSFDHARDLLGERRPALPSQREFAERWRQQLGLAVNKAEVRPTTLQLLPEFHPLAERSLVTRSRWAEPFWRYLANRGYSDLQASWLAESYALHYCTVGAWAWRLIVPIYTTHGQLATWTGRTIHKDYQPRYKTLPSAVAVVPPTDLLLGLPLLWEAQKTRMLVICEGPFDALSISALGHSVGVWGTCLFGKGVSPVQAELLADLEHRFERIALLLDADAAFSRLALRDRLPRRTQVMDLPAGVKDPGDLTGHADWIKNLVA
jgi:hypothetical protein